MFLRVCECFKTKQDSPFLPDGPFPIVPVPVKLPGGAGVGVNTSCGVGPEGGLIVEPSGPEGNIHVSCRIIIAYFIT